MFYDVKESLFSKKEDTKFNIAINALIGLVVVVLLFEVFFSLTYSGIYVIGTSMNNTLTGAEEHFEGDAYLSGGKLVRKYVADTDGDYVYVKKNEKPDYGDIVVVNKDSGTAIIKRVIAKGGDYVKIDAGKVYIKHSDEETFPSEPIFEEYVSPEHNDPLNISNTFHNDETGFYVEKDSYFLLGDNRNVSLDSRANGGINFRENQIFGVVTDWAMKGKSQYTALHKFFAFDLPSVFGIDNRIKNIKEV